MKNKIKENLYKKCDINDDNIKIYQDRIKEEWSVIKSTGFVEYFFIVADIIDWCKKNNITTGTSRGSVGGSLIAYLLDIIELDAVKNNLSFSRFMSSERIKQPDIDNDIQKSKRQQVLAYIQKYGEENVSQIGAYSTYTQKNAFADVARVFGIEAKEVFSITKIMEDDKPITIDQIISVVCVGINGNATEDEKKYKETVKEKYTKILDISKHMKGLIRHFSRHAAGVIILDKPIYEYLPTVRANEDIISAIDGDTLTAKGFLKIDLLGLDALDIISDVLNYIKRFENKNINLNKIDIEDNNVLKLFRDKDTDNIFQFDTRAMQGGAYVTKSGYKGFDKGLLGRIEPTTFEHLVHLNAINRPGPLSIKMDVEYENRKKGADYKVPKLLEKHLKETYGLLLFQEQIINVLADWLDINLGKADIMRKQMEKSTIKDMFNEGNYYHHLFEKYDKKEIEEALNMLQESGGYVFNKSHSAGYSLLGYQMMFLKCYYRKYFNVAILNTEGTDEKKGMPKIRKTLQDCMKNKWLKPYHLNEISYYFTFDKDGMIIPGVRILNGVGEKTIESVIANKPYRDLADFLTRANCNKTVLEALNENGFFTNTFGKAIDVNQIREDKEKNKKKKKIVQSEQLF
jgi:DNA polymerase-3 subunit alpha